MIDKKTGEPYINVWFGNFYRPAYDGEDFIDEAIKLLKENGFNSIMLDSKAWEDFRERYAGGEASTYVKTQEYMMKRALEEGMTYEHLSLYLNADNLYPNIRFSPPIYGESVTKADGTDGKWYKYWSDKAKDSMTEHIKGLYKLYGEGFTRLETKDGKTAEVMCTMWDPIVAPSFDKDGEKRYISWLKNKYKSIDVLNKAYKTGYSGFDRLKLKDVWYETVYEKAICTSEPESMEFRMWSDNQLWKRDELCLYFEDMQKRLKEVSSDIYTCPDMAQWSYFLNVGQTAEANVGYAELWDTATRGIDIYKLKNYVDCAHWITVPITPMGDPDAYVVSCQHAMMRAMNEGREFIGGVYYGRFIYDDVYEYLTPCEIIGSMVGSGISGYTSYGMCGLDDGGVLHRMPGTFNKSLKIGNEWAKKVIPLINGKRKKQVAILFPSAMALVEPMGIKGNKERRHDLLGYYKMCCDYGYMVDVIDADMIANGTLSDYDALIIPRNDCYLLDINTEMEKRLAEWTDRGGIIISSPDDKICERTFDIHCAEFEGEPICYGDNGLTQSDKFVYFDDGASFVKYIGGKTAVAVHKYGKGRIFSFGFEYGYSYCAKIAPHVPLSQKNNELYPIPMMKHNIVDDILSAYGIKKCKFASRNVEAAVFDDCMVITNHNSEPVEIDMGGEKIFQYDINGRTLMPRSAVYVKIKQD